MIETAIEGCGERVIVAIDVEELKFRHSDQLRLSTLLDVDLKDLPATLNQKNVVVPAVNIYPLREVNFPSLVAFFVDADQILTINRSENDSISVDKWVAEGSLKDDRTRQVGEDKETAHNCLPIMQGLHIC